MQQAVLSDRYVDFANHCLQLAAKTTDERSRRILREMASKWLELAEMALAG
jgi:ribosomal protein S15P/S13E